MERPCLMRAMLTIALFVAVTSPSNAEKKPAITEENLAKLQTVKVLFVDGNSESADKLREKLESWTCLKLTNNKSQAGAIMNVEERPKPDEGMNWLVTSITITTKTGDQVWSRSKGGGGFVNSGAGRAAENLF